MPRFACVFAPVRSVSVSLQAKTGEMRCGVGEWGNGAWRGTHHVARGGGYSVDIRPVLPGLWADTAADGAADTYASVTVAAGKC